MSNAKPLPPAPRKPSLVKGMKVLVLQSRFLPERVSKRTGEKKPAENRSRVLGGTVVHDFGDVITCRVQVGKFSRRVVSAFYHEVTLEENFCCGLTN